MRIKKRSFRREMRSLICLGTNMGDKEAVLSLVRRRIEVCKIRGSNFGTIVKNCRCAREIKSRYTCAIIMASAARLAKKIPR